MRWSLFKSIVVLAALVTLPSAAPAGPEVLTGVYRADDGGVYLIRFADHASSPQVYWYGEGPTGTFANVFAGRITANLVGDRFSVSGDWWDVPKRTTPGHGRLNLTMGPTHIYKESGTGDHFGAAVWTKVRERIPRSQIPLQAGFFGEGLTGIWRGNNNTVTYIRQIGSDLVWYAESCEPGDLRDILIARATGSRIHGRAVGVSSGQGFVDFSVAADALTAANGIALSIAPRLLRGPVLEGSEIGRLRIQLLTGDDNLRSDVNVSATVELTGARILPRVTLIHDRELPSHSNHTAFVTLPPGTTIGDLESLTLGLRGSFGDPDKWDIDQVIISAEFARSIGPLICLKRDFGKPLMTLRAPGRSERIDLRLPR